MQGSRYSLEVNPRIPESLNRLPELAGNLIYSWDRDLRRLFRYLDSDLYDDCSGNLKLFLRRVSQARIDQAANDPTFRRTYNQVLSAYDSFHARELPADVQEWLDPDKDLIAYFCFEFGFHESLPIYSGGLGILAGDHCKAAADLAIPLVAIGLMYHQGYFEQRLDSAGGQIELYQNNDLDALPLELVRGDDGQPLRVDVPSSEGPVHLQIWQGRVGRVRLYLLDADLPDNPSHFRAATHRLYGGGEVNRIRQEIVLGIGGVRVLRALGLNPTVWHLNEGHPAFLGLERCRELLATGHDLDTALELLASNTVFTTHTPVPAGHDVFDWDLAAAELGPYVDSVGLELRQVFDLGGNGDPRKLNMTALALRTSRFRNGVSRVHGGVAAEGSAYVWPDVPFAENPLSYVTNGVHLQTFLALEWVNLFDVRFSAWRSNLANADYWKCIDEISNHQFRALRQELKSQLFTRMRQRLLAQHRRNGLAETAIDRVLHLVDTPQRDVLVLGFARRFATYKRATLIFSDRERLARLLNDPDRPVMLVMAGKAHPDDQPGKELIREIYRLSMEPEFIGKVHLLENYDLALGRLLATGVDVWLNTPEFPLEASGTSGMKAAVNGVVNLSVLDGWWAEGFDGTNGWGIRPHDRSWDAGYRQRQESEDLLEILERKVIPLYFDRRDSEGWSAMAKASMRTIIPRFNAERMLRDYLNRLYGPALRHHRQLTEGDGANARTLVQWKRLVEARWNQVGAELREIASAQVQEGSDVTIEVEVRLNGLQADQVCVECLVEPDRAAADPADPKAYTFSVTGVDEGNGSARYRLQFSPPFSGLQHYRVRLYPSHPLLSHRFEMGRMIWL
jgi:glycogen phosphorylase